ncbi:hypothetical protein KIPB_009416, partial [Kipferlia bialata]
PNGSVSKTTPLSSISGVSVSDDSFQIHFGGETRVYTSTAMDKFQIVEELCTRCRSAPGADRDKVEVWIAAAEVALTECMVRESESVIAEMQGWGVEGDLPEGLDLEDMLLSEREGERERPRRTHTGPDGCEAGWSDC